MSLPISWRLAPGQLLLHRCWGGECVLYNDLTGDTHLVDEFALELLELLRAAPMPATLLGEDASCATVLADLAALHLIEAAPC